MRVRIEDVARAAGVSMKTVSRVLNNEPNVRPDKRRRVEAAVGALNYKPLPSARSLAGRKSYVVALLYDNPSANYNMEVISGVLDACDAQHYSLMLCPLSYGAPAALHAVETLLQHAQPDGVILSPPITDDAALLNKLTRHGIPYSRISPSLPAVGSGVRLDDQRAVGDLMEHLVSLGHRRIAHIKGHPAHGASVWRLAGYREGLKQARLRFDPALVVDGEFSFDSGLAAAHDLLALDNPPTAIFAANDDMAAGAMRAAYERGLQIPRDVSICGFDDSPMARQLFPALTTVRQPCRDMGRLAALELLAAIGTSQERELLTLPYVLQLRQSTGAAPERAVRTVAATIAAPRPSTPAR